MKIVVQVGRDYLVPGIGIVYVEKILPSGAAVVIYQEGCRWLVSKDAMENAELCLFS